MKIRYLGHAAFELVTEGGKKVVFDPYEAGSYDGALGYGPITGTYDLAVVSHDHPDHCCGDVTSKAGKVIDSAGSFDHEGVSIATYPTFHDETQGSERGKNLVTVLEADGLRIAHLGDLGHPLAEGDIPSLTGVDVLFVPVGGFFTIDAKVASETIAMIGPRLVIPMHFKTPKIGFPIASVENFTGMMENVEQSGGSEITVTKDNLPEGVKVVVLDPAL